MVTKKKDAETLDQKNFKARLPDVQDVKTANPVVDFTKAEKRRENLKPQLQSAKEQHAVIEVTHDMAVLEAAQDLIFDTLGIDLDELKKLAPTIDKLIAASQLGLDVSLHIKGGDFSL